MESSKNLDQIGDPTSPSPKFKSSQTASFQPNSIRTLQRLKMHGLESGLKEEDVDALINEQLYAVLDKDDKIFPSPKITESSLSALNSRQPPVDVKLRSTISKFQTTTSETPQNNPHVCKTEDDPVSDDELEELLNPRNFYNHLYQNDDYLKLKSSLENEVIMQTKLEVERKCFLHDVDSALADLQKWKEERKKMSQIRDQRKKEEESHKIRAIDDKDDDEDPDLKLA